MTAFGIKSSVLVVATSLDGTKPFNSPTTRRKLRDGNVRYEPWPAPLVRWLGEKAEGLLFDFESIRGSAAG